MRPLALLPALLSAGALAMAFLCVFAGSSKGFMEDFAIVTVNTSRIGENILNGTSTSSSSNPLSSLLSSGESAAESELDKLNNDLDSLARRIGVKDFYSWHLLDYCEGYYTPQSVPNATVTKSDIHENITYCSPKKALFGFNATDVINHDLQSSGLNVNLGDLDWPSGVEDGVKAIKITTEAAFILYCIAIGFLAIALIAAIFTFLMPRGGRVLACLNIIVMLVAFLAIAIASACVTAVMIKGVDELNKYGHLVGISAYKGWRFLALTWGATAATLVALLLWGLECCCGADHRRRRSIEGRTEYEKRGVSLEQGRAI